MPITKYDNGNLTLRFAVSQGSSMAAVDNVTWEWRQLVEKLSVSITDPLTLAQFNEKTKDWQNARKQSGGYFIGGQMKGRARMTATMRERQLLTYDIDAGDARLLRDLREGKTGLGACEYVVHSTRTHGGGAMKLRVIVPLLKLLPKEDFQAVARVGAWNLDCNMEAVDPVSFRPAQIMYWPAHCKDVEPIFIHHRGPLLNVYGMLRDWGGNDTRWRDLGALPRSPRQDRLHANMGRTHQPPWEKRGPVGAFCRTWTVHEAILEFLPKVYEPSQYSESGEPERYSFLPGTSGNGLVVFPTGHVMSFHGSDPLSEMNVNAFDMVRIHLFGDKDKPGQEGTVTDPRQMASYKAMVSMLLEYPAYVQELRDSNYGISPEDADDAFEIEPPEVTSNAPEPGVEAAEKANWRDKLEVNEKGTIKVTLHNLVLIIQHGDRLQGCFGYNEFTREKCLIKPLRVRSLGIDCGIPPGEAFEAIEDHHVTNVQLVLEAPRGPKLTGWSLRAPRRDVDRAVDIVCRLNPFHPPRDHINALVPVPGVSLLDQLWVKTCHTPDTPYYRAASRNLLIASVARLYTPGTKFDYMPVLIGLTGIRKSSLVRILGTRAWSTVSEGHYDSKQKFVEAAHGFWFIEHAEMQHFRRAADEQGIKAMLSGEIDRVRLAYRENGGNYRRQFVIIGTTEDTQFLRSYHRRIWPIACGDQRIDTEWLEANREQLFAEAVVAYRAMIASGCDPLELPLNLRGDAEVEFGAIQAEHQLPDDAEAKAGIVREYLDEEVPYAYSRPGRDETDTALSDDEGRMVLRNVTCALEVYSHALRGDVSRYDRRIAQHVGDIMKHLEPEWKPGPISPCGKWGRQRTYRRMGTSDGL